MDGSIGQMRMQRALEDYLKVGVALDYVIENTMRMQRTLKNTFL
jgi:hypothetical protein